MFWFYVGFLLLIILWRTKRNIKIAKRWIVQTIIANHYKEHLQPVADKYINSENIQVIGYDIYIKNVHDVWSKLDYATVFLDGVNIQQERISGCVITSLVSCSGPIPTKEEWIKRFGKFSEEYNRYFYYNPNDLKGIEDHTPSSNKPISNVKFLFDYAQT